MRTISVVVVAFNETKNLTRLQAAVYGARLPDGWMLESVLVDNGSTDGTAEVAERLGFTRVVKSIGTIAAARNAGWRAASGELVAYTDADCEPDVHWVEEIIRLIGNKDRIVGWPVEPPRPMTWVQAAWHAHWTSKRGRVDEDCRPKTEDGRPIPGVICGEKAMTLITTANLSLRRETMNRLGGFDEGLESGEDMNLLLRAQGMGVELVASPSLRVTHHGEPHTLREFYHQQQWHCSKGSFGKILKQTGRIRGGNAVWFTLLFGVGLALGLAGIVLAVIIQNGLYLMGLLPLLGLIGGPAVVIACRAMKRRLTPKKVVDDGSAQPATCNLQLCGYYT